MFKSKLPIFSINSLVRRNHLEALREEYCPCVECSVAFSAFTLDSCNYLPSPNVYSPFCMCGECSSHRHTLLTHHVLYSKTLKSYNKIQLRPLTPDNYG